MLPDTLENKLYPALQKTERELAWRLKHETTVTLYCYGLDDIPEKRSLECAIQTQDYSCRISILSPLEGNLHCGPNMTFTEIMHEVLEPRILILGSIPKTDARIIFPILQRFIDDHKFVLDPTA